MAMSDRGSLRVSLKGGGPSLKYQAQAVLTRREDPRGPHELALDATRLVNNGYRLPEPATLVAVGRIVALCSFTEADGLEELLEWFAAAQRAYGNKRLNRFILDGVALRRPRKGWRVAQTSLSDVCDLA